MNSKLIKNGYNWGMIAVVIQVILSFAVAMVASMVLGVIVSATTGITDQNELQIKLIEAQQSYGMVVNAVSYIIANSCAVFIAMAAARRKGAIKNWFGHSKIGVGLGSLLCTSIVALSMIGSMIINLYHTVFKSSGVTESIATSLFSDNKFIFVVTILYVCIVGPFLEEFLFRGFVLHETYSVSPMLGIVISAVLFGLFHGNFEQAINATLLGLLLGYVTLKANSIWPAVCMHIANNSFSCIATLVSEKCPENQASVITGAMAIFCIVFGIVGFVKLFKKCGRLNRNEDILDSKSFITDEKIAAIMTKENKKSLGASLMFSSPIPYIVFAIMFGFCLILTMTT